MRSAEKLFYKYVPVSKQVNKNFLFGSDSSLIQVMVQNPTVHCNHKKKVFISSDKAILQVLKLKVFPPKKSYC